MKRNLWLVATLALAFGCTRTTMPIREARSLAEARALAASESRAILIDVSTHGCAPCKAFDQASTSDNDLREALAHVILIRSAPDGAPDLEPWRRNVSGYPTFILLDREGREIDRWSGFGGADNWRREFDNALAQNIGLDQYRARHEREPTVASALRLARIADDSGDPILQLKYLDQALTLPGEKPVELRREQLRTLIAAGFVNRKELPNYDQRLIEVGLGARDACRADADCLLTLARIVTDRQLWSSTQATVIESLLTALPPQLSPEQERRRVSLRARTVWMLQHDQAAALALWQQHLESQPRPSLDSALEFAAWAFEERIGFAPVEAACLAALEAATEPQKQAALLDAIGEARFNLGRVSEAIDAMDRAATLEPTNPRHAEARDAWRVLSEKRPTTPAVL
ncbi:MAG: thioredoxin family protein [Acidobacteriota bacterium]